MKKVFFIALTLAFAFQVSAQYNEQDIHNYLDRYKELAIWKMYEYKIPASITLAQGVFESACGTSRLATEGNNHFGIKCHKEWEGDTLKLDDDELQECFRKYSTAEESYTDHSLFLSTRARYASLFQLDIMDYKAWATGLKAAGYATNPQYAQRLIDLIERYNIAHWDTVFQERVQSNWFTDARVRKHIEAEQLAVAKSQTASQTAESKTGASTDTEPLAEQVQSSFMPFMASDTDFQQVEYPFVVTDRKVYVNNRVYFVIANDGDTYASIAKEVQDSEKNIKRYNDTKGKAQLVAGEVVYVNLKSKSAATDKTHTVKPGETLRYISQMYGIQLSSIFKYNNLSEKSVIHPGDVIFLKR